MPLVIQIGDVRIHCPETISPRWVVDGAADVRLLLEVPAV